LLACLVFEKKTFFVFNDFIAEHLPSLTYNYGTNGANGAMTIALKAFGPVPVFLINVTLKIFLDF
jgi:hypothetical protein